MQQPPSVERAPLVALQVEYSLSERTVEGELVPMAQELGLGVLPWSPLRMGVLSGKYTRKNREKLSARSAYGGEIRDKDYDIIDQLEKTASELGRDVPTVALAWVQSRPGAESYDLTRGRILGGEREAN